MWGVLIVVFFYDGLNKNFVEFFFVGSCIYEYSGVKVLRESIDSYQDEQVGELVFYDLL